MPSTEFIPERRAVYETQRPGPCARAVDSSGLYGGSQPISTAGVDPRAGCVPTAVGRFKRSPLSVRSTCCVVVPGSAAGRAQPLIACIAPSKVRIVGRLHHA